MSAEDHIDDPSGEMATGYIQPEDLVANLKDQEFGPRARKVAQGIIRMAARLQKAIEEDDRFGDEPDVGSVIAVTKVQDGRSYHDGSRDSAGTYTYVFYRSPAGWHATGRSTKVWDWESVVKFIGSDTAKTSAITGWEDL
jgi:hypothetical protein